MSASFTPAARTERRYFANQVDNLCKNPIMSALLAATGGLLIVMWEVWNDAYIPPEAQSGIFQKHFSTKASTGRGMGTHSMKLLGEKRLNGKVTFSSSLEAGTTFCFKHPLHPCD